MTTPTRAPTIAVVEEDGAEAVEVEVLSMEVVSPSCEEVLEAVVSVSEDELVLAVFVLVCSCGVDGVPVMKIKSWIT